MCDEVIESDGEFEGEEEELGGRELGARGTNQISSEGGGEGSSRNVRPRVRWCVVVRRLLK